MALVITRLGPYSNSVYASRGYQVRQYISNAIGVSTELIKLNTCGHLVEDTTVFRASTYIVSVWIASIGGKGGFGTLLKKKGMKVKTHNFESSRDLTGRRLRDVEAPKRLRAFHDAKKWEAKLVECLGGEDPFMGKRMTAQDAIEKYQVKLHEGTTDPFDIAASARRRPDNPFVNTAAHLTTQVDSTSLWKETSKTHFVEPHHLNIEVLDL